MHFFMDGLLGLKPTIMIKGSQVSNIIHMDNAW
jgi:hypothetical protein